jgi:serine/threonine-protein kinase
VKKAADAEAEALVGHVLDGRYRIEALLGRGGMGAVYRATHVHLEQRFAIKVLRSHLVGDAVAARRLAREAKGTFQLDTEHAVKVADFGATESGLVYLVMEYLDGRTVADELTVDGVMAPARAARIATQLCDALAAAHRLNFIHRDIKPENVMLVRRGADPDFVKVLDFGLAKLIEGAGGAPFSIAALTQNDMVFGTPEYMAPEQAMGHALDGRADLYAVGATLFEMLTGRPPFVDPSPMKLLAAHVRTPPPRLRDVRAELAEPALEALLLRCLAKSPDDRPPTADALAAELRAQSLSERAPRVPAALASSQTVDVAPAEPPRPSTPSTVATEGFRRSTRTTIAAVLVTTALLGILVAVALTRTSRSTSRSPEPFASAEPYSNTDARIPLRFPDAGVHSTPVPDGGAVHGTAPIVDAGVQREAVKKEVVAADPVVERHMRAAEAARRSGNRLRQLAEADAALEASPKLVRAKFLVGEALLETGDVGNGCRYLRQARRVSEARALLASGRCPD